MNTVRCGGVAGNVMMRSLARTGFVVGVVVWVGALLTVTGCAAGVRREAEVGFGHVRYFEIPVTDMGRAVRFYERVFEIELELTEIDGHPMALFPAVEGSGADAAGASGALAMGESYVPSVDGSRVYFRVADIDAVLARAVAAGGEVLYAKKSVGEYGHVAEFKDSEGNRVALSSE